MSDLRVTESGQGRELILGGALTIENAAAIRKWLMKMLIREDEIVVCVDADVSVDLSFLQLLCSAHRTASNLGKAFLLRAPNSGNFPAAVENSGYGRIKGCAHDKYGTCLWSGGRNA